MAAATHLNAESLISADPVPAASGLRAESSGISSTLHTHRTETCSLRSRTLLLATEGPIGHWVVGPTARPPARPKSRPQNKKTFETSSPKDKTPREHVELLGASRTVQLNKNPAHLTKMKSMERHSYFCPNLVCFEVSSARSSMARVPAGRVVTIAEALPPGRFSVCSKLETRTSKRTLRKNPKTCYQCGA